MSCNISLPYIHAMSSQAICHASLLPLRRPSCCWFEGQCQTWLQGSSGSVELQHASDNSSSGQDASNTPLMASLKSQLEDSSLFGHALFSGNETGWAADEFASCWEDIAVEGLLRPRVLPEPATAILPDEVQICRHSDGSEWVLGAGTYGIVCALMQLL